MSGYLGSAAFSGIKAVHTDSTYSYNDAGGTYNYNDTFVVYGQSGAMGASGLSLPDYPVLDTPSLDIESSSDNAIVTVTLQGELKGFPAFLEASLLEKHRSRARVWWYGVVRRYGKRSKVFG